LIAIEATILTNKHSELHMKLKANVVKLLFLKINEKEEFILLIKANLKFSLI